MAQTPLSIIKKKKEEALVRIAGRMPSAAKRVSVGMATCEIAAGSKEVLEVFQNAVKNGLTNVYISQKGCVGRCNLEPTVEILEPGKLAVKYCQVTKERAEAIVERHLRKGEVIEEWMLK